MTFSRSRSMLAGAVLFTALWPLPREAAAASGYEESFRQGVRAGDLKKWQEAAARMADAIAENPTESKQRIALSGVFSSPYVPHFYRGWFLYQQGIDHCEESLREFEISREQGVVLTFKKQLGDLEKAREICGARVLPQAIEAAETKIDAAERRLSAALPLDDSGLRQERRQAREKLEAARASLESGRRESRLRSIHHAAAEAESVAETLAGIDREASRRLREEADALRSALERSRTANAEAAPPAAPAASPVTAGSEEVTEAVGETAEPASPVREPRIAPPVRSDPSLVGEIRRLTESAELFLDRIGAEDSASELLELQRSRLSNLVFEARGHSVDGGATASALEALLGRLSDSLSALQLIAGAHAYFAGNPQQALELLSANDPPASSLGAHFHLFLSASRFALFQVGLLDNTGPAGADARRCRELDPQLAPDPRAFSPSFRQFFTDALAR